MPRKLGVLIFPNFQILDVAGPIAAFEIAERYVPGSYELSVMAAEPGLVASSSRAAMAAEALSDQPLDTLMVSGGDGTRSAIFETDLIDWVRTASGRARRTTSVCSGAFLLAEAGLLDGRRATTHWQRCPDFARRYPKVRVEPDRIFVRDGEVWTSAGITAGIDLALALVATDLGEPIARAVAQQLVVYHRRPGGQSQFSALIEMGGQGGRFAELLDWMRERISEPLSVERMADRAAMSPRHFARAFAAETGLTPAKAVERLRLETARERVEASSEPIDRVAESAGFGDPERMRRAFLRAFGQPPQALRRAARA
ncbi:GlxA family transcriptional regulator [Phenylobacterium sp.]|uniref:GlxA family transcriptional regulator n=1 Tax=Phenylobacterium sp. TaxID=1871053 RepID=UPI0027378E5A|nr:GlxA family transcriptional regulator [Phenylobacterium sp.]MDP3868071.1 GlxA family transcriptional regulator [Phenylobacterium sp.]